MSRKAKAAAEEPKIPEPRHTPDLIGHATAEERLLQAALSGRMPHAWLFAGPRGIGKATLAYRFARWLLAEGEGGAGGDLFGDAPRDLALDPEHPVFRRVASGGHRDLMSVERGVNPKTGKPRTEIVVEEVRPVRGFLRMTAAEGSWRVVIVDGAEDMNLTAANALLKVLEEPPPATVLILVCHAPGSLLPTIRSRCCRLALAPLAEAEVAGLLRRHLPELAEDEVATLARLAEGSIGRGLELWRGGGLELYRDMLDLLDGLPRLDVPGLHAFADRVSGQAGAEAFRTLSELLTWWLARLIRAGSQGRLPAEVVEGEGALMGRLLAAGELARWLALWENLSRLFARAEGANLDRKQVVVTAFVELEAAAR